MILDPALHQIELGQATAKEARKAVREFLQAEAPSIAALYTALRSWTWNALVSRRGDHELSEWHSILKAAGTAVGTKDSAISHYLHGLAHLVDDSLRHAAANSHDQLLARSHLGDLLTIIQRNNGQIERERLAVTTTLNNSRLSQLLTDLVSAGLVDREQEGRKARFILTQAGTDFLERWQEVRRAPGSASEPPRERLANKRQRHRDLKWHEASEARDKHYVIDLVSALKAMPQRKDFFSTSFAEVAPELSAGAGRPRVGDVLDSNDGAFPVALVGTQLKEMEHAAFQ